MKDEMKGFLIKEIAGLRAKMYSVLTDDKKETKKAKRVKKLWLNSKSSTRIILTICSMNIPIYTVQRQLP